MGSNRINDVAEEQAKDVQAVVDCVAAARRIPSDVARRVRERAEQARQQLLATHGVQDIGVRIIREIRGELPQP